MKKGFEKSIKSSEQGILLFVY